MRGGTFCACCARAADGQAAAAPPKSVMKSRRCISDSKLRRRHLAAKMTTLIGQKPVSRASSLGAANVALGSIATEMGCQRDVRDIARCLKRATQPDLCAVANGSIILLPRR